MDSLGIKPNYAALGRKYDMDWRTVKKYHEGYKGKPKTRKKNSKLDPYKDEIKDKLAIKRVSVKGVHQFLVNKYGYSEIGTYSNFNIYVQNNNLIPDHSKEGHPRVETLPGKQAQVDWKEDIKLTSKYGEIFVLNIFHIVLSFSRFSYIELALQKRIEDVYRGLINGFELFGGVPEEIVFDNMSTVANTRVKPKRPTTNILNFAKDYNFKVRLCATRAPQTKGCVEAKNKILDWIRPYEGEFEDLDELIAIVKKINNTMNITVNAETEMSPSALFYKEKEYLNPIPCEDIADRYLCPNRYRVANDALIRYGNNKYSVDPKLINEEVTIDVLENNLYIYYKGKLVTYHPLIDKKINYKEEHYNKLMKGKVKQEDMEERVKTNLKVMDSLLELRKMEVTPAEAVKSVNAFIAFLNQNPCGKWIINYYSHLSNTEQLTLRTRINGVLPYVKNKDVFIENLKYSIKQSFCKDIDFDCCLHDSSTMSDSEIILTDEGYKVFSKKYENELYSFWEDAAREWNPETDDESELINPEETLLS